jgi:hypothetical protein
MVGDQVHRGGQSLGHAVGHPYLDVATGGPALLGEQVEGLKGGLRP